MKIELGNIKHAKHLSEETEAFSANVMIDGKIAGTVSNHGTGGPNQYHPFGLHQQLEGHAKTLPNLPKDERFISLFPDGMPMDADLLIGELLTDFLVEKKMKTMLANKVVFFENGKILATNKLTAAQKAALLADPRYIAKYPNAKILNLLPTDEALKLFKTS